MSSPQTDVAPGAALEPLFAPRSIAVVGASDKRGNPGGHVIRNLLASGFAGPIHPVNTRGEPVSDLPAATTIDDVPEGVDLAVFSTRAELVPDGVRACGERGVRAALVLSSGFAETGRRDLQNDLVDAVSETGIRLCGPNCAGFLNQGDAVSANFATWGPQLPLPVRGTVAIVSQSGGFGNFIMRRAIGSGLGLDLWISTGNEVDVCVSSAIEYALTRDDIEVVLAFAETIKRPDVFVTAARRARALDKPIVVLKAGRSEPAQKAALSHTDSIAGSAAVFDAVCEQHGVHLASTVDDLVDLGATFCTPRRSRGRGVAILTSSGGAGVLLADSIAHAGLEVPEPTPADKDAMAAVLPDNFLGSLGNPVDITTQRVPDGDPFGDVLAALARSDVVDMLAPVVFHYAPDMVSAARAVFAGSDKPMAVVSSGPFLDPQPGDPPVFTDSRRAALALRAVARQSESRSHAAERNPADALSFDDVQAAISEHATRPFLLESDALRLLADLGVNAAPGIVVDTPEAAADAWEALGARPVVVKVMSYAIAHKTEYGAVQVGLDSRDDVVRACEDTLVSVRRRLPSASIEGFLVQRMVPGRVELTCGMHRDDLFGTMVVIGVGGTMIEMLAEVAMLQAPFDLHDARAAVRSLLGGRLVTASRGLSDDEVDQVAAVAEVLGGLALACPEVQSIDVNPIRIADGAAVAADALIVTSAAVEAAPPGDEGDDGRAR